MTTIQEQKEIAFQVLRYVQRYLDDYAIIAGGACRNWEEGRLAKDIDIYLRTYGNIYEKVLVNLLTKMFKQEPKNLSMHYYVSPLGIQSIFEIKYKNQTFQLIFVADKSEFTELHNFAERVIKSFPVSISQIWTNTKGLAFSKSLWYREGKVNNTIYITDSSELRQKYIDKIKSYYPNHKFVKIN